MVDRDQPFWNWSITFDYHLLVCFSIYNQNNHHRLQSKFDRLASSFCRSLESMSFGDPLEQTGQEKGSKCQLTRLFFQYSHEPSLDLLTADRRTRMWPSHALASTTWSAWSPETSCRRPGPRCSGSTSGSCTGRRSRQQTRTWGWKLGRYIEQFSAIKF